MEDTTWRCLVKPPSQQLARDRAEERAGLAGAIARGDTTIQEAYDQWRKSPFFNPVRPR